MPKYLYPRREKAFRKSWNWTQVLLFCKRWVQPFDHNTSVERVWKRLCLELPSQSLLKLKRLSEVATTTSTATTAAAATATDDLSRWEKTISSSSDVVCCKCRRRRKNATAKKPNYQEKWKIINQPGLLIRAANNGKSCHWSRKNRQKEPIFEIHCCRKNQKNPNFFGVACRRFGWKASSVAELFFRSQQNNKLAKNKTFWALIRFFLTKTKIFRNAQMCAYFLFRLVTTRTFLLLKLQSNNHFLQF